MRICEAWHEEWATITKMGRNDEFQTRCLTMRWVQLA